MKTITINTLVPFYASSEHKRTIAEALSEALSQVPGIVHAVQVIAIRESMLQALYEAGLLTDDYLLRDGRLCYSVGHEEMPNGAEVCTTIRFYMLLGNLVTELLQLVHTAPTVQHTQP